MRVECGIVKCGHALVGDAFVFSTLWTGNVENRSRKLRHRLCAVPTLVDNRRPFVGYAACFGADKEIFCVGNKMVYENG